MDDPGKLECNLNDTDATLNYREPTSISSLSEFWIVAFCVMSHD